MKIRVITGILLFIHCLSSCTSNTNSNIEHKINPQNKLEKAQIEATPNLTFHESINNTPLNLENFIPTGYSVIDLSSGDLNNNGLIDKILVLRKNTEAYSSNYADYKPDKRPLMLLIANHDNTYELKFRNDNVVSCIDCAGIFGDPFVGVSIKNGAFTIEDGISGGHHWEKHTTFKYYPEKQNWYLDSMHFTSYKWNDSNAEDAEILIKDIVKIETINDFGEISFSEFDYYNDF
mgnify:CR=1 FL=1